MATFRILPDRSTLEIAARSSLHPIEGSASGLTGVIDAETAGGRLDLSSPPQLRLEVPTAHLSSGNALYDGEMQRRLDTRRYPRIVAEANEVRELSTDGRYAVRGTVTLRGQSRPVDGELRISAPDERTLIVEGEQTFDIREFGIDPPRIAMLKVHPDVKARIHLVAERE